MLTRSRQRKNDRLGFTLMEVLLVMAILVILGSIVVASFTDILATSKEDAAKTQLQMFELPLNNYQMHVGQFPSSESGLEALRTAPADGNLQQKWRGPYLQKSIPTDPWGNPYNYERANDPQTNRSGYRIWSVGADMSADTDDDITVTSY
ncbi:MAG TPA: type II secretion system protein GspG [Planctomycetes bacterium]|jgi:general secretion pathway protein G|nr:type II secretion system protein GspG [Planctomycetaceae bacterium]HIN53415.1 type II secretion system protein GspG [Planctomycetota bacterium]